MYYCRIGTGTMTFDRGAVRQRLSEQEPAVNGEQPSSTRVVVTGSGAVAAGGNVSINGAFAAGRDIHVGQVTVITDDGPPVGDQAARPGTVRRLLPCTRGWPRSGWTRRTCSWPGRGRPGRPGFDSLFRLVAVVGSSGSGKSSLINAAIVPRAAAGQLPGGRRWSPVVLRPGPDPLDSLATAERSAAASWDAGAEGTLWVIDQFEEAFDSTVSDAPRAEFLARVVALAQSGSQDRVLLALRSDFYASLDVNPVLARLIATAQHRLVPLDLTPWKRRWCCLPNWSACGLSRHW